MSKSVNLIILRHGESLWNKENRFTGWVDVDLSEKGVEEAKLAGKLLQNSGIKCQSAYTSYLLRAVKTLWLALESAGQITLPVTHAWQLNERHYGALTGLNKAETAEKYGEAQVKIWRRSYATRPPLMTENDPSNPALSERYAMVPAALRPLGESLDDTVIRVSGYFKSHIEPKLRAGENTLIVAHGNSLRALIKFLENLSEEAILEINIPTGVPTVYTLQWENDQWRVLEKKMLGNADDIAARMSAVATQAQRK